MANLSKDIQGASSDTRPPMLDRTDFASWKHFLKGIKDNVKMLLEGSELTKEDRESQLYDDFEHFCQHKRETIHDYYVRFAKLIYDMRNIKMTMSRMQLNSKFVNNMLLEWGIFITAYYSQSSTTLPSTSVQPHFTDNTQLDSGLFPTNNLIENLTNTLALLTQSYKTYLPQNKYKTYLPQNKQSTQNFVKYKEPSHSSRWQGCCSECSGSTDSRSGKQRTRYRCIFEGAQNRVGNANSDQARQIKYYNYNGIGHITRNCTQPKRPRNSEYFKDKTLLMQAQENEVALDEEQLLFIVGGQDNAVDKDVDEQPD
uniref:Integrase, catalytic region, zinc finger, CCHC-type, peptidase aspartic, catalytic n=1 Tax=Tanacetum cinerariifolium TaxID=118510 RepID=A0A6L2MCG2_TANCI|nr:hypothetical protein [Tanacetum cinerariifolium]